MPSTPESATWLSSTRSTSCQRPLPGYPVEQIQFLHRAGWAGHGGIVALVRMYVNLNHPRLATPCDRSCGRSAASHVAAYSPCAGRGALDAAPGGAEGGTHDRSRDAPARAEAFPRTADGSSSTRSTTVAARLRTTCPYALAALREHAARTAGGGQRAVSDEGRAKLESVVDEVLVRENVGFDIWAHKDALDHLGAGIAEFDEVILTNDTWFGPVRPFGPVFDRMDARASHIWGMTDHWHEPPNPAQNGGVPLPSGRRTGSPRDATCSARTSGPPTGANCRRWRVHRLPSCGTT